MDSCYNYKNIYCVFYIIETRKRYRTKKHNIKKLKFNICQYYVSNNLTFYLQ